jgi:hypothetical protein
MSDIVPVDKTTTQTIVRFDLDIIELQLYASATFRVLCYDINDKLIDVEEVFKKERVPLSTKDPETIRIVNLMLEKD